MLRSVGAVLAGVLTNIVVVGAIDAGLRAAGVYPPMFQPMADHQWAIALACRLVFAVIGGFITARLAPARPTRHAVVLGGIETLLSVPFVLVNWNRPEFGPHWFAISVVLTCLPLAALGGMLGAKRIARVHQ
jgi:cytochrome bd-type quinol oxidase subunit 1